MDVNHGVTCGAAVDSDEEQSAVSDAVAQVVQPVDKSARDRARDQLRHSRDYQKQIEHTTTRVVRKPIVPGTVRFYQVILREWDLFTDEYQGSKDPTDLKTAKDFVLYFTQGRHGRNERGGRLTLSYTYTVWKSFMAAWSRKHQTAFTKSHQDTILNFIKGGEVSSPNLSRKMRPKRNFTRDDFLACIIQLWQNDWYDFDHERYRVGLHLLLLLHCNTSARRAEYEREWRYADITLSLVWLDQATQPQLVMDFQRNKAKGLQDWESEQPQHMLYELVNLPFYCNSVLFFIAAVLADDALRDYHSWDEICAIPKPNKQKHLILHWQSDKAHWPVFPRSSRRGQLDHNRTSASLTSKALVDLGHRAGFQDNVVLHAARREALLQVDNYGYSCNERMRFAAHINSDTYRRSYQTAMPMVDGQASYFRFEASSTALHDLRRSYGWQRNPYHQPKLKEAVRLTARDCARRDEERAGREASPIDMKERQKEYDRWRHQQDMLIREQNKMVSDTPAGDQIHESDFSQTRKLMPERDRLATMLFQQGSLRDATGRAVMDDLVTLCRARTETTYCGSLNSSGLTCNSCRDRCATGEEHKWWSHVYHCRKNSQKSPGGFAEFCFLCLRWYSGRQAWEEHTRMHTDDPPLRCSMGIFRHNVIRPGLCPSCLGKGRYHQYTNLTSWKNHIQDHVLTPKNNECPHPHCRRKLILVNRTALLDHLADVHDIRLDKGKRQKVLDRSDRNGVSVLPKTVSFIHTSADDFIEKVDTEDGATPRSRQQEEEDEAGNDARQLHLYPASDNVEAIGHDSAGFAHDFTAGVDGIGGDDDGSAERPRDMESISMHHDDSGAPPNDHSRRDEDDHDSSQRPANMKRVSNLAHPSRANSTQQTRQHGVLRVMVNVPPVPSWWTDALAVGNAGRAPTFSLATARPDECKVSKPSRRGRPPGSRNRSTIRQENQIAKLGRT